jgi:acyl transferase domain-containing protein
MERISKRLGQLTPLQRAVFALKESRAKLDALERAQAEPIAIVGLACRFPGGAIDAESFWHLLRNGVNAVREVPAERWDIDAYYDPDPKVPGKMNTRLGAFIDRVDEFDNKFFGISAQEAPLIDPQHRVLLELAWEALEDAGLVPGRLAGSRTGVYVGISTSDYGVILASDNRTDPYIPLGTSLCVAANRISFAFDLRGPSVALDTACSSSLVAVHLACRSLRSGETQLALAGAMNMILSPHGAINLTKGGLSSPDGRCRSFDAGANGYCRGEGGGLVVLKLLSAASRTGIRSMPSSAAAPSTRTA